MRKINKKLQIRPQQSAKPFDPNSIVSDHKKPYAVPKSLIRYIKTTYNKTSKKEGNILARDFAKWFSAIKANQKGEYDAYKAFNRALELAGGDMGPNKQSGKYSPNYSHVVSNKMGGSGYTFLEWWKYNQARSSDDENEVPFIDPKVMKDANLPSTWYELFLAWQQELVGNRNDLGTLGTINSDDLIALHRGEGVEVVRSRRQELDKLYELAINDPYTITDNAEKYNALFAESRGLDVNNHIGEFWLQRHTGYIQDKDFNWIKLSEEEIEEDYKKRTMERFAEPGQINYGDLPELQPEEEITSTPAGDPGEGYDSEALDAYQRGEIAHPGDMKHKWLQNPFANVPKPEYDEVYKKENKSLKDLSNVSKTVIGAGLQSLGVPRADKLSKTANIVQGIDNLIQSSSAQRIESTVNELFEIDAPGDD